VSPNAGKTASGGKNNNRNRTKKQAQLAKIFTESNTEPRYTSFSAACEARTLQAGAKVTVVFVGLDVRAEACALHAADLFRD
jgi:hypothetical protein